MGTFGAYLEQYVLDHIWGSTGARTAPATLYFGLCTTDISSSGEEYVGKEPSTAGAYARVAITNTSSNFTTAETSGGVGVKYNAVAITFPQFTTASTTITYAFCVTASCSTGSLLCWGALTTSKTLASGDTASFAANAFKITLD
jgi:hypothetical protein